MKRSLLSLSLLALCSFAFGTLAQAADATPPATPAAAKADKPVGFRGTVTKVDAAAKTFSLNGPKGKPDRVFVVNDATKITKDDKPATLADMVVGEYSTGSSLKDGDTLTAKTLKVGVKQKEKPAAAATPAATPAPKTEPAKPGSADPVPAKATPAKKK